MKIDVGIKLHNKFEFELRDSETGVLKQKEVAYNIILDGFFTYFTKGVYSPFYTMNIGTGTGTIDKTRTSLFANAYQLNLSTVSEVYAHPTSYKKWSVTLGVDVLKNTTITEVGLRSCHIDYYLDKQQTHALLQDAEGNPISIAKGELDILTIYATFYITLPSTIANGNGFITPATGNNNGLVSYLFGGSSVGAMRIHPSSTINPSSWEDFFAGNRIAGSIYAGALTNNAQTLTTSWATARANIGDFNGFIGGLAFSMGGKFIFGIKLPDSSMFSGMEVPNINVGTGDGIIADFDIKVPIVKSDTEIIKVDGVTKTRDIDYTFLYDAKYMEPAKGTPLKRDETGGYTDTTLERGADALYVYGNYSEKWPVMIDLTLAKVVSSVWLLAGAETLERMWVQGSNDEVNWTAVVSDMYIGVGGAWTLKTFASIAAFRYYRFRWYGGYYQRGVLAGFALPYSQKAIHFLTAPPQGAAITASCQTEYTLKNANNVLDISANIVFGRGTVS